MILLKKIIILMIIITVIKHYGQLKKVSSPNFVSEAEIYYDENDVQYSDLVTFKCKMKIVDMRLGDSIVDINKVGDLKLKQNLERIKNKYGEYKLVKLVPTAAWGDTLVTNRRSGKTVKIPDWSQVYQLKFANKVPIDIIISELNSLPVIEYAEGPFYAYTSMVPNDYKYQYGRKWAFEKIEAEKAWDITKGDSTITIAIHDRFGDNKVNQLHCDLIDKVDSHFGKFGNHGICVAGIAGANTNNEIGVASLGWNIKLRFYNMIYNTSEILRAINDNVDIINFSWTRRVNLSSTREAIKTALSKGIVCVAAAGNNQQPIADTVYPAAYNFGELGQVIAVSGTIMDEDKEKFIDGFNYSPGNNPISDPTSSFIDVAAPGANIDLLSTNCSTSYEKGWCGTSLAAPFVSSLAGLILSIDSTFTPNEVYKIITESTDKIGQYSYNNNGWNQYLGYGRINAKKALEYAKKFKNVTMCDNPRLQKYYRLKQNYPNPFNPSTNLEYRIGEKTRVILKVYDILGKEITTLVNEEQLPGSYGVEFNSTKYNNVASGVYIFRLSASDFNDVKKGILIK